MVVVRQGKSKAICILLLVLLFLIGHEEAYYYHPQCHGMTTMYVIGYESPCRQLYHALNTSVFIYRGLVCRVLSTCLDMAPCIHDLVCNAHPQLRSNLFYLHWWGASYSRLFDFKSILNLSCQLESLNVFTRLATHKWYLDKSHVEWVQQACVQNPQLPHEGHVT